MSLKLKMFLQCIVNWNKVTPSDSLFHYGYFKLLLKDITLYLIISFELKK